MRRHFFRPLRNIAFFSLLVACGSRTGLFADEGGFTNVDVDGGPSNPALDGGRHRDGDPDDDVVIPTDAPPPLDVQPPIDVNRSDCPDADSTFIYTIDETYNLQSFNPASGQFKNIGAIACPAGLDENGKAATPFSMAVDRKGVAYVLFTDLNIYRVSTLTAACIATPYVSSQAGFKKFGMGFTTLDAVGPKEGLYVAADTQSQDNSVTGLGLIDPTTFNLVKVGDFFPEIDQAELTGTGDGRLFAYYGKTADQDPSVSYIGEIDPKTATVIGERKFDNVAQGQGWAFGFWGGDFYIFHAPLGTTVVTRYRPSDDSVTDVASTSSVIVGAGVSTCAPQQ